jgi:hypothetical protein
VNAAHSPDSATGSAREGSNIDLKLNAENFFDGARVLAL